MAKAEANGVPDAVLNRTRCFILVPAQNNEGIVSCFEALNQWTRPDLVTFKGQRALDTDLLIFLIGENEAKSMRGGRLDLGGGSSMGPGPLVRSKPVVTDADLSFGSLAYQRRRGVLAGTLAPGSITSIGAGTPPSQVSASDRRLQRSLISYFNAITPTGIIIHHTAVLPTLERVPLDRREVDNYHSDKGFDVVCFGNEYHVAYHYLILPDGKVQAGRPERCQGGHAKGYNAYLGISVAGDFSSKEGERRDSRVRLPSSSRRSCSCAGNSRHGTEFRSIASCGTATLRRPRVLVIAFHLFG